METDDTNNRDEKKDKWSDLNEWGGIMKNAIMNRNCGSIDFTEYKKLFGEDVDIDYFMNNKVDIGKCMNQKIVTNSTSLETAKIIGSGAYGAVFEIEDKINKKKKYAIKCQYVDSADCFEEVNYSILCGKLGTGPPIYDCFYYQDLLSKMPPAVLNMVDEARKEMKNKTSEEGQERLKIGSYVTIQFIVMKSYDTTCKVAITSNNPKFTEAIKTKIINEMCKIVDKNIANSLYFYDIKFNNFVVNIEPFGEIDVKMIDFDPKFCEDHTTTKKINNELFGDDKEFTALDFTNIDIFHVSSIMMLLFSNTEYHGEDVDNDTKNLLNKYIIDGGWFFDGFINTYLHKFLTRPDWEKIIKIYIEKCTNPAVSNILMITQESNFISALHKNHKIFIKENRKGTDRLVKYVTLVLECLKPRLGEYNPPLLSSVPVLRSPTPTPTPTPTPILKQSTPAPTPPQPVPSAELQSVTNLKNLPTKPAKSAKLSRLAICAGVGFAGLSGYVLYKAITRYTNQNNTRNNTSRRYVYKRLSPTKMTKTKSNRRTAK